MNNFTYRDKAGVERCVYEVHFTWPYALSSSRRWWEYLRDMNFKDHAAHIKQWYKADLIDDAQLWDVLGSFGSPVSAAVATEIYEDLGFDPMAGFPLKKKEIP